MDDKFGLKPFIDTVIQEHEESLRKISSAIHSHPELAMKEVFAHDTLCTFLESQGFTVERGYLGIATAFLATFINPSSSADSSSTDSSSSDSSSSNIPTVATLCEYDALPGIGHACGHNLIATSGVAAGLVAKALLQRHPDVAGRVLVMGTPAEEALGGKCMLLERGAFKAVDAALMVHPTSLPSVVHCTTLAIAELRVVYRGQTAHASAVPWLGVNALDALVSLYNMIALNRQGMRPEMRIHGIIVDGGQAPNIIPDRSEGLFYIRAATKEDLEGLKAKVANCAEAAALSTGCRVELIWEGANYLDVKTNPVLAEQFTRVWSNPQVGTVEEQRQIPLGSTDMGNVSYAVPGIHPCYYIPAGLPNHTAEFTEAAGGEAGFQETLSVSKVMGLCMFELFKTPELLVEAKKFYNYTGY